MMICSHKDKTFYYAFPNKDSLYAVVKWSADDWIGFNDFSCYAGTAASWSMISRWQNHPRVGVPSEVSSNCGKLKCHWQWSSLVADLNGVHRGHVHFQVVSTTDRQDSCKLRHMHFGYDLVHDQLPGRIKLRQMGLLRVNSSTLWLWT